MITTEIFLFVQLFGSSPVSWWWVIAFLACDEGTWYAIKRFSR